MIVGRSHTERRGRLVGTDDGAAIDRPGKEPRFLAFHGFTGTTSEIRPLVDAVSASEVRRQMARAVLADLAAHPVGDRT